jgi:hypothetical protein
MNLETASGYKAQNVTEAVLNENLAKLNEENDFLILSNGDDYIQCAWSKNGFIPEYQDTSGHYSCSQDISVDTVSRLFSAYLSGSREWTTLITWESQSMAEGSIEEGKIPGKSESFSDSLKGELSPGKIFDSVKKQISRELGSTVSRKTSGLLGKIIRKVIK